jgi:hypothetical protein
MRAHTKKKRSHTFPSMTRRREASTGQKKQQRPTTHAFCGLLNRLLRKLSMFSRWIEKLIKTEDIQKNPDKKNILTELDTILPEFNS